MRTLPITAQKEDIVNLLFEWTELLAEEKYPEALAMFLIDNSEGIEWTAEILEQAVYGYGCIGFTREEITEKFGSSDYKITSVNESKFKDDIIDDIEIDYIDMNSDEGTYGATDKNIIGIVHYNSVLLNEEMSDLTAIFWMVKIDENNFTLKFNNLHVM